MYVKYRQMLIKYNKNKHYYWLGVHYIIYHSAYTQCTVMYVHVTSQILPFDVVPNRDIHSIWNYTIFIIYEIHYIWEILLSNISRI